MTENKHYPISSAAAYIPAIYLTYCTYTVRNVLFISISSCGRKWKLIMWLVGIDHRGCLSFSHGFKNGPVTEIAILLIIHISHCVL